MKRRLFIVGPTAVGKTALSLALAEAFHGEILSMDSMQIYRGMDIGTAKATPEERSRAPHHLIDIAEPGVRFTVHDYSEEAKAVQEEVHHRGHLPIFVGGAGLYMDALLHDYTFTGVNTIPEKRKQYQEEYDRGGGAAMLARLEKEDPETAKTLSLSNRRRLIRALEVLDATGKTASSLRHDPKNAEWESLVLILYRARADLYEAIDARVDIMWEKGLRDETEQLIQTGLARESQAMQAIGYRETAWFLRGWTTESETLTLIKRFSRQYAKRQLTWFKKTNDAVWLDVNAPRPIERAKNLIAAWMEG